MEARDSNSIYVHTYIYTYMYTYICTYIHTYINRLGVSDDVAENMSAG
jgi:hypothetical protein